MNRNRKNCCYSKCRQRGRNFLNQNNFLEGDFNNCGDIFVINLSEKQKTIFDKSMLRKYGENPTLALLGYIKSELESIYGEITDTKFAELIDWNQSTLSQKLNTKGYTDIKLPFLLRIENSLSKNNKISGNIYSSAIDEYIKILGARYILIYKVMKTFYRYTGKIYNFLDLSRVLMGDSNSYNYISSTFLNYDGQAVLQGLISLAYKFENLEAEDFRYADLQYQKPLEDYIIDEIKKNMEDLKSELHQQCKDYIFEYIFPDSMTSDEFDLVSRLLFYISKAKKKELSLSDISQEMGLNEQTIKNKIRDSVVFSAPQILIIDLLIKKYKNSNPDGEKIIRDIYFSRYLFNRKASLITSEGYNRNWERLYSRHCYNLLLDQLGVDLLDGEPLTSFFGNWRRHHWWFNIESIELADLILVSNSRHSSAYSHPMRPLASIVPERQSQLLGKNKEIVKNIIRSYLNSEISLDHAFNELPSSWSKINKNSFLEKLKFLNLHSENRFFMKYYKAFYELYKDSDFWGIYTLP